MPFDAMMILPALAPLIALLVLSAAGAVFHGVLLWRVSRAARLLPTARDGLDLPAPRPEDGGGWPTVCVVVPAHNEREVIGALATSLMAQDYPSLRIVFALDRCTDETESIIRERCAEAIGPRVEIVGIGACPAEWAGKTHALWRGVRDSAWAREAEMLLFADADTIFDPALVRAAVALLYQRELDLLSLLSRLSSERWFERIVQPAAAFELIRQHPLDFVNSVAKPRAFANGQFMLFRREFYDAIGGHEAVKHELLEDLAFARLMRRRRKRAHCRWGVLLSGPGSVGGGDRSGMLRCRMYGSWESFKRGWKRIYAEAAHRKRSELLRSARKLRVTGVGLPLAGAASVAAGVALWSRGVNTGLGVWLVVLGLLGLGLMAAAMGRIYRSQGTPARFVPLYPIGAWMVARILSRAARDLRRGRRTVWGGREYAREDNRT